MEVTMKNRTTGRNRSGLGRMTGNGVCRRNSDDAMKESGKGNGKNRQQRRCDGSCIDDKNRTNERPGSVKEQVDE